MKRARNRKNKERKIYNIEEYYNQHEEQDIVNEDTEPNDFAVPEDSFGNSSYDTLPDNEIPFSQGIFDLPDDFETPEEAEETEIVNDFEESEEVEEAELQENVLEPEPVKEDTQPAVVHSDEYLRRKAINRKKYEQKMKRRRTTTICVSVFLILVIGLFAVLGMDFSGSGTGDGFMVPVDTSTGKLNILLLGVDKEGERSDSIMLVSYDFDEHYINLLSVPRDTKMYVTDRSVTRKITEVHGMHNSAGKMYGAAAVAESVTNLTGIPINYYLEFSFDALDNVMDILGPVEFDVPDLEGKGRGMNYDDPYQDLHIHLKPGLQKLSGNQIQQFLRYRKSNYGTSDGSDISRVARQQDLLKAIIDQKVNLELIVKLPEIFKEVKSQLKTNFTVKDIIKYTTHLKNISSENMTTYVLPGESKHTGGAWYYICDFTKTAELITNTFGYTVTAEELSNEINLTGKTPAGKANTGSNSKSNSSSQKNNNNDEENKTSKTEDDEEKEQSKNSSTNVENSDKKTDNDNSSKNEDTSENKKDESEKSDNNATSKEDKNNDSNEISKENEDDEVISLDE